jgi:cyanophycinase
MLVLVGSGEYLAGMEPVDRFVIEHLSGPARVVCLPTAAGTEGPERIAYWSNLGVQYFTRFGALVESLPVIDRASANDPSLADRVRTANFVYLSGGKPDYLYNTLQNSLVWDAIQDVLAKGGALAGCSAGAMIMGEFLPGFPMGFSPHRQRVFNLLPGATVVPHYDEIPAFFIQGLQKLILRDLTILGIEGYTALIQQDGYCKVVGQGGVTVWNRAGKTRYVDGQVW